MTQPVNPLARRNDLELGSEWSSLRVEAGADGRHSIRQPVEARLVGVFAQVPYRGRTAHLKVSIERTTGPLAGVHEEWEAVKFINLWTRRWSAGLTPRGRDGPAAAGVGGPPGPAGRP